MSRLVSFVSRPLFALAGWIASRFGLCMLCGKNELCFGGKCLACCERIGDPAHGIDAIVSRLEALASRRTPGGKG